MNAWRIHRGRRGRRPSSLRRPRGKGGERDYTSLVCCPNTAASCKGDGVCCFQSAACWAFATVKKSFVQSSRALIAAHVIFSNMRARALSKAASLLFPHHWKARAVRFQRLKDICVMTKWQTGCLCYSRRGCQHVPSSTASTIFPIPHPRLRVARACQIPGARCVSGSRGTEMMS